MVCKRLLELAILLWTRFATRRVLRYGTNRCRLCKIAAIIAAGAKLRPAHLIKTYTVQKCNVARERVKYVSKIEPAFTLSALA